MQCPVLGCFRGHLCPWYPLQQIHKVKDKDELDQVIKWLLEYCKTNTSKVKRIFCPAPAMKDEEECLLNDWSVKNLVKEMICMKMTQIFNWTSLSETTSFCWPRNPVKSLFRRKCWAMKEFFLLNERK